MNLNLKTNPYPNTKGTSALFVQNNRLRYRDEASTLQLKSRYRGTKVKVLPIVYIPGYSKSIFNEVRSHIKKSIESDSIETIHSIRNYLSGTIGVFSNSHYSAILKPKLSTSKLVAGVSRDKGRSILTKLVNQFNRRGNQRTVIKHVNSALCFIHAAIKMDRSIDKFISIANSFNQL